MTYLRLSVFEILPVASHCLITIDREHVDGSGARPVSSRVWLTLAFLVGLGKVGT